MRCAKCHAAKQPHTVVEEDRSNLGAGKLQRSWDHSDREHVHDPRWDVVYLVCSNGHAFKAVERIGGRCPVGSCDFEAQIRESIRQIQIKGGGVALPIVPPAGDLKVAPTLG